MSKKVSKNTLNVNQVLVRLTRIENHDYVSLTNIAKEYGTPSDLIKNWLRTPQYARLFGALGIPRKR